MSRPKTKTMNGLYILVQEGGSKTSTYLYSRYNLQFVLDSQFVIVDIFRIGYITEDLSIRHELSDAQLLLVDRSATDYMWRCYVIAANKIALLPPATVPTIMMMDYCDYIIDVIYSNVMLFVTISCIDVAYLRETDTWIIASGGEYAFDLGILAREYQFVAALMEISGVDVHGVDRIKPYESRSVNAWNRYSAFKQALPGIKFAYDLQ